MTRILLLNILFLSQLPSLPPISSFFPFFSFSSRHHTLLSLSFIFSPKSHSLSLCFFSQLALLLLSVLLPPRSSASSPLLLFPFLFLPSPPSHYVLDLLKEPLRLPWHRHANPPPPCLPVVVLGWLFCFLLPLVVVLFVGPLGMPL